MHFVITGDLQRFYDDVGDMVTAINQLPENDAVFITGDLTDFSIGREFLWLNKELKNLRVPFLTVIGNHDCLANGTELYEDHYGSLNYSFTWNSIRFLMHNTNSREFSFNGNVPDMNWIRSQLADSSNYKHTIFISHVPPGNDDFDASLASSYINTISAAKGVIFSANGHNHDSWIGHLNNSTTWNINTCSPDNRRFAFITIYIDESNNRNFNREFIPF